MIRVSRMADYAVLILYQLGTTDQQRHNVESLASATALSSATVRKIMNILVGADLVVSHRGATGGYELARPLASIRLLDAISALEGPVNLTACCTDAPDCELLENCHLRDKWPSINDIVIDTLSRITVADFAYPSLGKVNSSLKVVC